MDNKNSDEIPWVEKYRPTSLNDVASQTMTIKSLKQFVKKGSIPHMIFAGPAGTGKTSAAKSLINDLIGRENITQDLILERNASDNVRMNTRDEIKNFVNHISIGGRQNEFKFVILDEADNIPSAMQGAFRRIIELSPSNVKFIFMCNFVERIIDPLLSRCAIFRFYPLPEEHFKERLIKIADTEKITVDDQILDAFFFICQGDLRMAINLLQTTVTLLKNENHNNSKINIDPAIVYNISGFLNSKQLNALYRLIQQGEFSKTFYLVQNVRGISSRGLFRQLMMKIIENNYPTPYFEQIIVALGEYDYRLTLQADHNIQICSALAEIISEIRNINKKEEPYES